LTAARASHDRAVKTIRSAQEPGRLRHGAPAQGIAHPAARDLDAIHVLWGNHREAHACLVAQVGQGVDVAFAAAAEAKTRALDQGPRLKTLADDPLEEVTGA